MADQKPASPSDRRAVGVVVRDVIRAITGREFFGPGQPLRPSVTPSPPPPRIFDYLVARNLTFTPRSDEAISYDAMRNLADACDLLRLFIEKRKRQMTTIPWQIRVRKFDGESARDHKDRSKHASDDIDAVTAFFKRPDGEHSYQTWFNAALEERFVTDATSLFVRRNRGGQVLGLDVLDGATIHRLIDAQARTPMPPDPAYQQIIKGFPFCDLTTEDLMYRPKNYRVHKIYGYSPVEQIILTINIALRRQIFELNYYTEGNVPEALAQLPANWTIDQIEEFQTWFDSVLAGNLANRRKITFLPELAGSKASNAGGGVQFTKQSNEEDQASGWQWLARVVAFAFDISPQALIQMMNRATAQTAQQAAEEEGLNPELDWWKENFDDVIENVLGYKDLEWAFQTDREVDKLQQAQIHKIYVDTGILSIDEVREELGRDAIGQTNAIVTPQGLVPVGQAAIEADVAAAEGLGDELAIRLTDPADGNGNGNGGGILDGAGLAKRKLPAGARGDGTAFRSSAARERLAAVENRVETILRQQRTAAVKDLVAAYRAQYREPGSES